MKIEGTRPDGSLDARVESCDGWLRSTLEAAKSLAQTSGQVIHFSFNNRLMAVGPQTKLKDIELVYHFGGVPAGQEIGPMPESVPDAPHGTFELNIDTRR